MKYSKVGIAGIARAGGTFIWQIVNNINKFSIKRTHNFCNDQNITFVTYRDFRDVLVSWSKSHEQSIQQIVSLNSLESFNHYLKDLLKTKKEYWDNSNYHFIKYEDYFPNNTKSLIEYIHIALECELNNKEYDILCEKFSLKNAKAIANKYATFTKYDEHTKIHGRHITNNGEIGAWQQYISDVEIMKIFNSLSIPLKEFGYQI